MQKQNVMMWLAHKNFPYGIVFFCDGLARDPQRHKAAFLQSLQDEVHVQLVMSYVMCHHVVLAGYHHQRYHNQ